MITRVRRRSDRDSKDSESHDVTLAFLSILYSKLWFALRGMQSMDTLTERMIEKEEFKGLKVTENNNNNQNAIINACTTLDLCCPKSKQNPMRNKQALGTKGLENRKE